MKGYIDRIERTSDGDYVVVDFKTGSKPGTLTKNSVPLDIQLNLYCLAIKEMYGKLPQRASFYFIKDKDGRLFPDERDDRCFYGIG